MASSRNRVWRVKRRLRSSRVMCGSSNPAPAVNWLQRRLMARAALSGRRNGRPENGFEAPAQHRIDFGHGEQGAQILEGGDALVADAAGHDAVIMAEIGRDIERNAVEGHPFAHAHAD